VAKECNDIPNDDTSRYFIDHTVHGTMGSPYDIDDTIQLGASLVPKTVKINEIK